MSQKFVDGSNLTQAFGYLQNGNLPLANENMASDYDNTKAYTVGQYFNYQSKIYCCFADAPSGTAPTNTTYFGLITILNETVTIIKITDQNATLGNLNSILNGTGAINPSGLHVMFDLSSIGTSMSICTVYIDTTANKYVIFDLVQGRIATGTYASNTLISAAIANISPVATQAQITEINTSLGLLEGRIQAIETWSNGVVLVNGGDASTVMGE